MVGGSRSFGRQRREGIARTNRRQKLSLSPGERAGVRAVLKSSTLFLKFCPRSLRLSDARYAACSCASKTAHLGGKIDVALAAGPSFHRLQVPSAASYGEVLLGLLPCPLQWTAIVLPLLGGEGWGEGGLSSVLRITMLACLPPHSVNHRILLNNTSYTG